MSETGKDAHAADHASLAFLRAVGAGLGSGRINVDEGNARLTIDFPSVADLVDALAQIGALLAMTAEDSEAKE